MGFEMKTGNLLKCKVQSQMGIMLGKLNESRIVVFMGDGLTIEDDADCWEVVPFNDFGAIPANFSELVEAYKKQRPD